MTVENGTLVIGVFQTATPNLEIDQLCETVGRLRTTDVVLDPPFVGSQVVSLLIRTGLHRGYWELWSAVPPRPGANNTETNRPD